MTEKIIHEVVVGNIGTVYRGTSEKEAAEAYQEYVKQSKDNYGRAAGEEVTWFQDGEIHESYVFQYPVLEYYEVFLKCICPNCKAVNFCYVDRNLEDPTDPIYDKFECHGCKQVTAFAPLGEFEGAHDELTKTEDIFTKHDSYL